MLFVIVYSEVLDGNVGERGVREDSIRRYFIDIRNRMKDLEIRWKNFISNIVVFEFYGWIYKLKKKKSKSYRL